MRPVGFLGLLAIASQHAFAQTRPGAFADVPPGAYTVNIRAVGFQPFTASIEIAPGQTIDGDLTLTPASILLDTIRSFGTRYPTVPWMLQEFESRRRTAATGQFLTDSALRARDDDMPSSLVGMFGSARLVLVKEKVLLASSRGNGNGKPVFQGGGSSTCIVSVYVDGISVYPGVSEPPDFSQMRVSDYSAVEFYSSPTEVPVQYARTGSGCSVILLWTRQRR